MTDIFHTESVTVLETTIDHITGEELGLALSFLNNYPPVLDAILLPAIGKKNRPANLLQVICRPEDEMKVCREIFRHTHALGIRSTPTKRHVLQRYADNAQLAGKMVRGKAHILEDRIFVRPEADEVGKIVKETGIGAPGLRWLKQENPDET